MSKYLVQKARDYAGQSAKWRKANPDLNALAQTHMAQKKYDGCHMIVRTSSGGGFGSLSRTGEIVRSCSHIGSAVARTFGEEWVVFGEVWKYGAAFPEISGKMRSHSEQPDLQFVPFDIVPTSAYDSGRHPVPYITRFNHLSQALRHGEFAASPLLHIDYYPPHSYIHPQELANQLVARGGSDGLILRDLDAPWEMGEAQNGEVIKVKPVMSFDLRVIGVEEGQGKMAGMAGALIVDYKGKACRASGGTFVQRLEWWEDHKHPVFSVIGDIVEIECLGITEDGLLREPRVKGIRYDKLQPDA